MSTDPRNAPTNPQGSSRVRDELKHDAEHLKDMVHDRAQQEAESHKDQAAHAAGSASSALHTAADELRDDPDAPEWLTSALQQAARKIEGMASQLEGRNVSDIGHDVTHFARDNPGAFLAASVAAGFAAARVLRAGADKKRHDRPDGNSGNNHSNDYGDNYRSTNPQPNRESGGRNARNDAAPGYMAERVGQDIEGIAP
jgi:hypothetical protein